MAMAELEAEAEPEAHIKEASSALMMDVDSSHVGGRNALFARRKDAGLQTTRTRSAKLHARSSSLHVTSRVDSCLLIFLCTSQNTKAVSTPASITREDRKRRKTTRITTATTILTICSTWSTSSSRSSILQTRRSCTTSLATTYTAETRRQHQRHNSCLTTATHDLCTKGSYQTQALQTYLQSARSNTSHSREKIRRSI